MKRKSIFPHNDVTGPPASRRQVSYEDIETEPAPPVPRQQVSYASDDEHEGNRNKSDASSPAVGERHEIMSCKSNAKGNSSQARPRTDVTYGQLGAFPGLDTYDNEPFYGPANDGLDYLRMVRSEARGIPHVVTVAQEPSSDEQRGEEHPYASSVENGHAEGYYEDGAYVARASPTQTNRPASTKETPTPQEQYYAALKERFLQHRARMHQTPSAAAVAALDDLHPISLPVRNTNATREWRTLVTSTTPLPAQLASMDSQTVLRILHLTEGHLHLCLKQSRSLPQKLSLWLWALLGRLDEEWTLQTVDIGIVRDLAKMSIRLGNALTKDIARDQKLHGLDLAADQLDDGDWGDDGDSYESEYADEVKDCEPNSTSPTEQTEKSSTGGTTGMGAEASDDLTDLLAAKKRQLLADISASEPVPDMNTVATLDMVITIAGDFYGQKDLLALRQRWEQHCAG
ncbi:hypothetical protein MBLNU459_g3990t1 [Dothideomycetes sp. NU459]